MSGTATTNTEPRRRFDGRAESDDIVLPSVPSRAIVAPRLAARTKVFSLAPGGHGDNEARDRASNNGQADEDKR